VGRMRVDSGAVQCHVLTRVRVGVRAGSRPRPAIHMRKKDRGVQMVEALSVRPGVSNSTGAVGQQNSRQMFACGRPLVNPLGGRKLSRAITGVKTLIRVSDRD
jgi:hypothetical protein